MPADPYKYFRVEARELLDQLGTGVLELEREGAGGSVVARLLRHAHTLKGASRVVKQPEIATLAHEIEDLLAPFRDTSGPVPRERLDGMLALLDGIGSGVRGLSLPPGDKTQPAADEFFRTLRTDVGEVDVLLGAVVQTQTCVVALRRTLDSLARARRLAGVVTENVNVPTARGGVRMAAAAVDLRALLIDLEGGLAGDAERVERELREVRSAAERLRLLPVNTLFGPLERTVRDSARAVGKEATFRAEGGEVRLDGHVLQALQGAILQVVRNSVAHGIEPASERIAAGKTAEGSVVLEVVRRGARVAFRCRDDGRGIDLAAVRRKLQGKGLLTGDTDALADDDLLRLLLTGGVSTSSVVTDVSGRGVGLDVVRDAAARLGAQVAIRTGAGEGTTVEIEVPVLLSSVEVLVVEAAGAKAAIPMSALLRTLRMARGEIVGSTEREAIAFEQGLVPFAPLARLLGRPGAGRPLEMQSVVILSGSSGLAAVGVDRLLETTTVLLRALPPLALADPIVAGIFIDAEGNPEPLVDADHLVQAVRGVARTAPDSSTPRASILVVDDSLTTRMLEQSILESAGYTVELATSAEEALEKAGRQKYGLFLVDVEMPGMDGFALLERFQAHPDLRRIPSILVTSRNSVDDRRRGVEVGARAYVVKGEFDQVDLLERIRVLVE